MLPDAAYSCNAARVTYKAAALALLLLWVVLGE